MADTPLPALDRLEAAAPEGRAGRVLLFAIRRMATGGLDDAHAAHAMMGLFGLGFRRPLVLLRATMAELARAARRPITVAPCCCPRLTGGEETLLRAIATGEVAARHARLTLLLGTADCLGAVTSAEALGEAFSDLGRPLAC